MKPFHIHIQGISFAFWGSFFPLRSIRLDHLPCCSGFISIQPSGVLHQAKLLYRFSRFDFVILVFGYDLSAFDTIRQTFRIAIEFMNTLFIHNHLCIVLQKVLVYGIVSYLNRNRHL